MDGNMTLGELIDWLEKQDQTLIVKDGFGSPHSDRGSYDELAFTPEPKTTIGEMLSYAKSAEGCVFEGWKGGDFLMTRETPVYIGECGTCGEEITQTHLKYWLLSARDAEWQARVDRLEAALTRISTGVENGQSFSGTDCADIARAALAESEKWKESQ